MAEGKKLTDKSRIRYFFILCFLAYYSTYLGRLNYAASLGEMIRGQGIEKGQAGLIGTAFFVSYGVGQLFAGFLGERRNCKRLVFAGLFVSAAMNLLMGWLNNPGGMMLVWCVNGLAQSMIWSPMLHMICELLDTRTRTKFCMYINYSVPLGTLSSYGLSALLIGNFGWRVSFFVPAVLVGGTAVLWLYGMNRLNGSGKECAGTQKEAVGQKQRQGEADSALKLFISSGLVFLVLALCMQGALKDGITTWIPVYLEENHRMGRIAAILTTMVIPVCNLMGVSLAALAEKITGENETLSASLFFGICACALAALLWGGKSNMVLAVCMLAVATTSMMSVNSLLISVLPSRFGEKGKASEVSGILNSCVYAGCAVSTYGIGVLSEQTGWDFTIFLWTAGAVLAGGICIGVSGIWRKYTRKYPD